MAVEPNREFLVYE